MSGDVKDAKFDVLKQAIVMEIAGLQFFLTAAEKTSSKKAREMFRQLAEDEVEHKNILENMMKKMAKGDGKLELPKAESHIQVDHPVIGKELKESLKTTWFDSSALNIGVMLEQRAIHFYEEEKKKTQDPDLQKLFTWLVEWERGHLETLLKIEREVKEEYWFDQGFWPLD